MAATNYLEVFQAQELLRLLDNTDALLLPVCVEHGDKPDFILSTRTRTIGLETSSFTDEEVMRANHLHFTCYPKAYITTTGLRDGPQRCSNEEIAATMLACDGPWQDVVDGAEHVVRKIFDRCRGNKSEEKKYCEGSFQQNRLRLFLSSYSYRVESKCD